MVTNVKIENKDMVSIDTLKENKTNCVHDVHGTVKNETSQYKSMIWVILLAPLKNGARTDQLPAKLKGGHW